MVNDSTVSSTPLTILVEVAYALPDRQKIITLQVEPGTTALDAVRQSGIAGEFPEIDVDNVDMGIFSKAMDGKNLPVPGEYVMEERDRIEIYRPLLIDPKAARLARAEKAKKKKAAEKAEQTDEGSENREDTAATKEAATKVEKPEDSA